MTESFGDMKASLENLVVEESPATEGTELQMAQPDEQDEQATRAIFSKELWPRSQKQLKKVRNLTQLTRALQSWQVRALIPTKRLVAKLIC